MNLRDIALAVFVAFIWGLNFVAIKLGLQDFPPLLFTGLRFLAAAIPLVFFIPKPALNWRTVVLFGLVLGVAKFGLLFTGMKIGMPAGLSSLVLQAQAFFTVLFAALFLHDRPTKAAIAGMAFGIAGLILISSKAGGAFPLNGFALVIAAAACWGVANIIMKRAGGANMLHLMVWMSLVPPLPLFGLSAMIEGPEAINGAFASMTWIGVGSLLYIAIFATLVGFAIWGALLRKYPAGTIAPFTMLVPVFGMSSAAVILGEEIRAVELVGALLILTGLALSSGLLSRLIGSVRRSA